MTAIITYFNTKNLEVIVACDSLGYSHGKNEKTDKGYLLYQRYFIAIYGPHILSHAIDLLREIESYENIRHPKNIEELCNEIQKIYDITRKGYLENSSDDYLDKEKSCAAIIFDEKTYEFNYVHFGCPFDEKYNGDHWIAPIEEGIEKFALFEQFQIDSVDNDQELLSNTKIWINDKFKELDEILESQIMKAKDGDRIRIGGLGTLYHFKNNKRKLESAFQNLDEILPLISFFK